MKKFLGNCEDERDRTTRKSSTNSASSRQRGFFGRKDSLRGLSSPLAPIFRRTSRRILEPDVDCYLTIGHAYLHKESAPQNARGGGDLPNCPKFECTWPIPALDQQSLSDRDLPLRRRCNLRQRLDIQRVTTPDFAPIIWLQAQQKASDSA